jgi:hypothetical protein
MSEKGFSLARAIAETLSKGVPTTGLEREVHFSLAREAEENAFLNVYRAGNPRDRSVYVPLEVFVGATRDPSAGIPSAGGALVGLITAGESPLRNWSMCLRAGALVISGLRENIVLWDKGIGIEHA